MAMKKIFKSLCAIVLCVLTCVSFAGCDNKTWSKTSNDTTKVVSNGGTTVYHDGWVYFINGTKEVSEKNNSGSTIQAGIYRAKADENGNVLYKETVSSQAEDDEKEEVKEYQKVEAVVKSLVGFDNGSLHIFGNYLYYATPSKGVNDEGDMLTGKTAFYRYDLKNKHSQLLYTTKASDDTVSYTYYKQGDNLYLVVYEKNSAILSSYKMGSKVKKAFVEKDVRSVVFSNNFGDVVGTSNVTDCFVYFTKDATENNEGNRVFRNLPNGKGEKLISEHESVSLLAIEKGYLIYQKDSITYAEKIQSPTTQIGFSESNVVYYGDYDNVIYIEENNKLGAIVYNEGVIRKILWDSTKSIDENVENMQPIFDELDAKDKVSFIGVDGDYLIYQLSKYIYKVKVLNISNADEIMAIKLSTTKMDETKENSLIAPEIVNGYVYGMYTDSNAKVTYMYRISIKTPKEAGEVDKDGKPKEVGDAEFIGIKE